MSSSLLLEFSWSLKLNAEIIEVKIATAMTDITEEKLGLKCPVLQCSHLFALTGLKPHEFRDCLLLLILYL